MLQYNDTSTYNGIIQAEERLVYSGNSGTLGRISNNTKQLAEWTIRNNQALNRVARLMIRFQDYWLFDDFNHGTINTATEDIVSGTREVALTSPEDVLFVYKVLILESATATDYELIRPMSIKDRDSRSYVENDAANVGIPYEYDKTGGYIILNPEPNYSATDGVKYYYQRTPHQFVVGDTTATAGIPAVFDELVPLYAVDAYATENTNTNLKQLVNIDIARIELDLKSMTSQRSKDTDPRLSVRQRSSR